MKSNATAPDKFAPRICITKPRSQPSSFTLPVSRPDLDNCARLLLAALHSAEINRRRRASCNYLSLAFLSPCGRGIEGEGNLKFEVCSL